MFMDGREGTQPNKQKKTVIAARKSLHDGINLLLRKAAKVMVTMETDGIFSERISVIMRARVVRC